MNSSAKSVAAALVAAISLLIVPAAGAKPHKAKAPLPDLVVAKVSKPPAESPGAKLSLSVQLRNKGRGAAGRTKIGAYLTTAKKRTRKDKRLALVSVKPLRAGKSARATLKLTIPPGAAAGSHRLIVCADDARRVRESKEGDNCSASSAFSLKASVGPPAPAFAINDAFDWGTKEDAEGKEPTAGKPIPVTLRAANGIAGQAGYSVSKVGPMAMVGGSVTTLDYAGKNLSLDDSGLTVQLPFAFPFGGINERSASVSTNGRIGFGSAATDWWDDGQTSDYRGEEFAVGNFERGIMPFWADLDLSASGPRAAGTVKEVVAPDKSFVAFQWETGEHRTEGPRRSFQVILYPDGRFRFDYPGQNLPGGESAFVGYSLGTGIASLEPVRMGASTPPPNSFQFVPNPVSAAAALPAGQATLTLPAGSTFVSADAGCSVSKAPSAGQAGLATCAIPALPGGGEAVRTVTFAMPANAIGQNRPADFRYTGTYTAGGASLTDLDELNALGSVPRTTIIPTVAYAPPPTNPKVGQTAQFTVKVNAGGLDTPSITIKPPANTVLNSIRIGAQDLPCGPAAGGDVNCPLPSGLSATNPPITVTVTPTAGAAATELTLQVSVQALNAPTATASGKSPPVEP